MTGEVQTILVVDDSEAARYVTGRILALYGFRPEFAASGTEAIGRLAANVDEVNLVILDVNLPDLDGLAVCRHLRASERTRHLPILMVSAQRLRPTDHALGLDQGADAYLSLPVEPEVLVATIRALLRIRAAEAQVRQLASALELRTRELEELNRELEARVAMRTRELEASSTRFAYQALHDPLTGLPNRAAFERDFESIVTGTGAVLDEECAVMIVDLDGLKKVNDSRGHARGDALIIAFGQALTSAFRPADRIYRLGGDEYILLLPDARRTSAVGLLDRVQQAVTTTRTAGFPECAASAGIAFTPEEGRLLGDLVRLADERMYEEKRDHKLRATPTPD